QHGVACRLVALLGRQVLADDAGQIALPALARRGAGEIEQVLNGVVRNVVRPGRIRPVEVLEIGQLQTELRDLRLDGHAYLPPSSLYASCAIRPIRRYAAANPGVPSATESGTPTV